MTSRKPTSPMPALRGLTVGVVGAGLLVAATTTPSQPPSDDSAPREPDSAAAAARGPDHTAMTGYEPGQHLAVAAAGSTESPAEPTALRRAAAVSSRSAVGRARPRTTAPYAPAHRPGATGGAGQGQPGANTGVLSLAVNGTTTPEALRLEALVPREGRSMDPPPVPATVTTAEPGDDAATEEEPDDGAGDPEPEPEPSPASDGAVWDRLAECESNGNWHANTGNGFYGGLQFEKESWDWAGGSQYAAWPHEASREQQIAVAEQLLAIHPAGWGAWPECSRLLGLR